MKDVEFTRNTRWDPTKIIVVSLDGGKHWCYANHEQTREIEEKVFKK